jgi:hypothetical protein
MKIQALWYGGINYALPGEDDIEHFRSLAHAKDVFLNRATQQERRYPCVENSMMEIYSHHYDYNGPDRIIRLGKRGGIIMERC